MFRKIDDFVSLYQADLEGGERILASLTDGSLGFRPNLGHRSIGEIAWHIVQSIPGMANDVGLGLDAAVLEQAVPASADEIRRSYQRCGQELLAAVQSKWTDATLEQEDNMYGEIWKRGFTLLAIYGHEVHHFGQLTVLMRCAGLPVHGRFGPSKEEWAQYSMEQPPGLA